MKRGVEFDVAVVKILKVEIRPNFEGIMGFVTFEYEGVAEVASLERHSPSDPDAPYVEFAVKQRIEEIENKKRWRREEADLEAKLNVKYMGKELDVATGRLSPSSQISPEVKRKSLLRWPFGCKRRQ